MHRSVVQEVCLVRPENYCLLLLKIQEMKELRCINDDIHMQVLSRLSTRNLHMLKCVCKEWRRLISDRSFICLQLKRTETVSGFFFQERFQWCDEDINKISYVPVETQKIQVHSTVFNFLPENVVILASCNGLICCRSSFPSLEPVIYVCNPLTKDWISVKWIHHLKSSIVALVFYPSMFPIQDSSTNFKIVAVSQTKPESESESESESETEHYEFLFEIYSSETGKWRQSGEICRYNYKLFKNKGIFVDGFLYWLTYGDKILMFNPETELSWLINIPLPVTQFYTIPEMCIGESKGKLHFVLLSEDGLQLWTLEDPFTSHWDLTFSVSLEELEKENSQFLYKIAEKLATHMTISMLSWINMLALKDEILFLRVSTDIYLYDFTKRKMKKLCRLSDLGPNSMYFPIVVPYTMSLVPLGPV